jgi:hypothetical protein
MKAIRATLLLLLFAGVCGCTQIILHPPPQNAKITEVWIQENPQSGENKFAEVIRDGFQRHGIKATITAAENTGVKDAYIVTYVAYRTWDFGSYLTDAVITITKNGQEVARAIYHLKARGGAAPTKWLGAKTKIDPMIDELLRDYPVVTNGQPEK